MKKFSNQFNLTMHWEGFSEIAYKDSGGIWTIGYGTALSLPNSDIRITEGMTCTQSEALTWLQSEMTNLYSHIKGRKEISVPRQRMKDSLCDYAYNVGPNGFPCLIAKLQDGDIPGAALEFLNGFYMKGVPLKGLLLRRISEYNTFLTGKYIAWENGDPISHALRDKLLAMNSSNKAGLEMIEGLQVTNL